MKTYTLHWMAPRSPFIHFAVDAAGSVAHGTVPKLRRRLTEHARIRGEVEPAGMLYFLDDHQTTTRTRLGSLGGAAEYLANMENNR